MQVIHLAAALFLNAESTAGTAKLSAPEAAGVVEAFRLEQERQKKGDKAIEIKSIDDALAVLKRDEIGQFGDAVEYTKGQTSADAKALRAQIELAWGDAQNMLADLLERTDKELVTAQTDLDAKKKAGTLTPAEQDRLDEISASTQELHQVVPALRKLAVDHFEQGGKIAQEVMKASPKDHQGYRVAADFYRLKGDWAKFDEMKKKIEATKPKSNGLVFLKGIEALERHKKPEEAAKYFREALQNDPKFTRAQAMLVLLPSSPEETHQEYKKLEELSPFHQIVVWVGSRIERAHSEALFAAKK